MSNICTITYNNSVISELEESGNVSITYNGSSLGALSAGGSKTLNCAGKVMSSNLVIGSKTLNCAGKLMATNIEVSVVSLITPATIIIHNADSTNYVKVGSTTYTAATTVTLTEEALVEMYVGSNYNIVGKNFTWKVDSGEALTFQTTSEDSWNATFTALVGYKYTIDASAKTIVVNRPYDWDGFIFSNDKPHYPYAPFSGVLSSCSRVYKSSKYYLSIGYVNNSAGIGFGQIDLTKFSALYVASSGADGDGTAAFTVCVCPSNHSNGSISSNCVGKITYTDGETTGELTTNHGTINLSSVSGNYYIHWKNGYYERGTSCSKLYLMK